MILQNTKPNVRMMGDVNEEFSSLVIYMSNCQCPTAAHHTIQYIKGIKFLPEVIGDVWHNDEGSIVRICLISACTLVTS